MEQVQTTETTWDSIVYRRPIWSRVLLLAIQALTIAYGLSIYGFFVLREILDNHSRLGSHMDEGTHLTVFPAFLFFIIVLALRRWRLVALLAPVVILGSVWYLPRFMPRSIAAAPENATQFSLMTYNINMYANADLSNLRVIQEARADVVVLQELTPDTADLFHEALAGEYQFFVYEPDSTAGVFSRFPVITVEGWQVGNSNLRIEMDINGTPLILYDIHLESVLLPAGVEDRLQGAQSVLDRLAAESADIPLILAGDLNTGDRSKLYGRFAPLLTDTFAEIGYGLDFTYQTESGIDFTRLDYIFHNDGVRALEIEVLDDTGGSDHHPLRAVLAVGE